MGRQRREFTPEYKDEAVKLVINTGRPVAVVARELGVKEQTLGRWVNLYKSRQDVGDGALSETERAELARLRKENSELKMDRAFLKKASLFFAQEASDTNVKRSHVDSVSRRKAHGLVSAFVAARGDADPLPEPTLYHQWQAKQPLHIDHGRPERLDRRGRGDRGYVRSLVRDEAVRTRADHVQSVPPQTTSRTAARLRGPAVRHVP